MDNPDFPRTETKTRWHSVSLFLSGKFSGSYHEIEVDRTGSIRKEFFYSIDKAKLKYTLQTLK